MVGIDVFEGHLRELLKGQVGEVSNFVALFAKADFLKHLRSINSNVRFCLAHVASLEA